MEAYIATNLLGCFAFDGEGKLLAYRLFPKNPEEIAEKLKQAKSNLITEERETIQKIKTMGYKDIHIDKKIVIDGVNVIFEQDHFGKKTLRDEFRKLALDFKWVNTQSEINEIITNVNVLMTKSELKKEKRDVVAIRSVGVFDDIEKTLNSFSERLREWYGLYFPELSSHVQSHEKFAELVAKYGKRGTFPDKEIQKIGESSSGMELGDYDLDTIRNFSKTILNLCAIRKEMLNYIEKTVTAIIPNTAAIATPVIAARMLMYAGSLEKLSRLPSSTIQLLGAEKALFRHLKGMGKAPKYGVLFAHPEIQKAPKELRGKIARLISSKTSIAARIDFFSGEDKSSEMKKELNNQIKKLPQ